MATDATGTPTSLGIPKYNTNVDKPSGAGFNAAMDAIDGIIVTKQLPAGTTNGVVVWNGSAWVSSQIADAQISDSAGIKGRKFLWSEGAAPPASPSEGDLWYTHPIAGASWLFRYDPTEDGTYPWQFIGGSRLRQTDLGDHGLFTNGSYTACGTGVTVPRTGIYDAKVGIDRIYITVAPSVNFWLSVLRTGSTVGDAEAMFVTFSQTSLMSPGPSWAVSGFIANAGTVVQPAGKTSTSVYIGKRYTEVLPVRVA